MRYLFNLFPIPSRRYPQPFDANPHGEGPLIGVTEPPKGIRELVNGRNVLTQFVGRRENLPKATYLPQHVEALS